MKRGRQPILVNKTDLQACVDKLESEKNFSAQSQLWEAIEQTEFAKNCQPRALTAQVAALKCKALAIVIKTPKGRRGNPAGLANVVRTGRRIRLKMVPETKAILKKSFSPKYHGLVDRIAAGSYKAVIRGMCLSCTCEDQNEIRHCEIQCCPAWAYRPFQKHK